MIVNVMHSQSICTYIPDLWVKRSVDALGAICHHYGILSSLKIQADMDADSMYSLILRRAQDMYNGVIQLKATLSTFQEIAEKL